MDEALRMNAEALRSFLAARFPQAVGFADIVALKPRRLTIRTRAGQGQLRPGGTISGPTLMTLADTCAYLLVLAHIGPVELAVTTHLSIDFLRKPAPGEVEGTAHLLKLGRRLAVMRVDIKAAGSEALVAHAGVTYSIPPERD